MESLQKSSEDKVDELIAELKSDYGEFHAKEKEWKVSADGFETEAENFRNGGYGGAGIWLTNNNGEVLLVKNKGDEGWSDPGGHQENEESFEEAAKRETKEETGVEAQITGIEAVDKIKLQNEENEDKVLYNPIIVFKGKYVSGHPEPQQSEIKQLKWWDKHPEKVLYEDLKQFTIPAKEEEDQ